MQQQHPPGNSSHNWHSFRIFKTHTGSTLFKQTKDSFMIPATQSALSALQAFGTKINSSANNVANASSENYKKTRVLLQNQDSQGVKAVVEKVETPGTTVYQETSEGGEYTELSNVDLAEEFSGSNLSTRFYQANLKTLQTADEMTRSVLDLKA